MTRIDLHRVKAPDSINPAKMAKKLNECLHRFDVKFSKTFLDKLNRDIYIVRDTQSGNVLVKGLSDLKR